jgi:hypothetical protein
MKSASAPRVIDDDSRLRQVASRPKGNPEGKGVNGFMLDWHRSAPRDVVAKPRQQVLAELFTSMLALSAAFKYRPAVGQRNYLYWINEHWSLSLIAPHEWSDERRAGYAGEVTLQRDMTWTIKPSEDLAEKELVAQALGQYHDAFIESLDNEHTLAEVLPFYVRHLPYYQRLFASALSRSLRTTIRKGDLAAASCRHWLAQAPRRQLALLQHEV